MQDIRADVCVIGAGSGGLSVASGAAQLGAKTVLIERGDMGGDCLNSGCVPSKALLHVAHTASLIRRAGPLGISVPEPEIDYAAAMAHVRRAIARIEPHDSQERFEGLGVKVIREAARFIDARTVTAGETRIQAKYFVIATGSAPRVPAIPGLEAVPFLTNETLFTLSQAPRHLAIIGAGAIGVEMAQAHQRLGSQVTLIEAENNLLPRDDAELTALLARQLKADGVTLRLGTRVTAVSGKAGDIQLKLEGSGASAIDKVAATHVLIATGRRPVIEGLGLDAAGVDHSDAGIKVGPNLRTSRRHIFGLGDVIGGEGFTHIAGHHASIVVREMLFRLPARVATSAVPRVTYTSPELAQIGMTAAEATAAGLKPRTETLSIDGNDRFITENIPSGPEAGLAKLVFDGRRGRLIGAGILAPGAGDLIPPLGHVIEGRLKLSALASQMVPYPTHAEIPKRAAGAHLAKALFAPRTRRLISWLLKLPG
ncbi:MAG: dihydrolipoamide dehydrogenase [Rhodospirillaceae bacterium]|nr:MAG: dihydrolipoamide dehydrogenase [Rhodospirillaceae bacterium]